MTIYRLSPLASYFRADDSADDGLFTLENDEMPSREILL